MFTKFALGVCSALAIFTFAACGSGGGSSGSTSSGGGSSSNNVPTPSPSPAPPTPTPTISSLKGYYVASGSIVYGNNSHNTTSYAAIYYSKDGHDWQGAYLGPKSSSFNSIATNGNILVASGSKPAYSTDGVNWTDIDNSSNCLSSGATVSYAGNMFFSADNAMCYSTDGINWQKARFNSGKASEPYGSVSYNGSTFVVKGEDHYPYQYIYTSTDGITWSQTVALRYTYQKYDTGRQGLAYGNGNFMTVVQNKTFSSTNGIDWIDDNNTFPNQEATNLNNIAFGNGVFVAVGKNGNDFQTNVVRTSSPANAWSAPVYVDFTNHAYVSLTFSNSLFFLLSNFGNNQTQVATSTDGTTWNILNLTNFGDGKAILVSVTYF